MKKLIAILCLFFTLTTQVTYVNNVEPKVNKQIINNILSIGYEHLLTSKAEYKAMSEKFYMNKPFTKLIKRQEMHIDMLEQLYKEYGLKVPEKEWDSLIAIPKTVDEFYSNALIKEKNINEMYKGFLKEELPEEVRSALQKLAELSNNNTRLYKFIIETKSKNAR